MHRKRTVPVWFVMVIAVASTGYGQVAIDVGEASAPPGKMVRVPVTLAAPTQTTALNLRLRYDPSVLTPLSVGKGPLLTGAHVVPYRVPPEIPGRFNVVVYPLLGGIPFTGNSGTVVELLFEIGPTVVPGTSTEITFAPLVFSDLPSSDLSDLSGNSLAHQRTDGRVTVTDPVNRAGHWPLYP
jgi:hypothetical protein